jgi:hypothetical protein
MLKKTNMKATIRTKSPTINQKRAFDTMLTKIKNKEIVNMGEIMIDSGYSKATAVNPAKNLTLKEGWKSLLAQIDDNEVLERVIEIATDISDKRACLAGADMIFKLKDRYPAGKLKVTQLEEEINELM